MKWLVEVQRGDVAVSVPRVVLEGVMYVRGSVAVEYYMARIACISQKWSLIDDLRSAFPL